MKSAREWAEEVKAKHFNTREPNQWQLDTADLEEVIRLAQEDVLDSVREPLKRLLDDDSLWG